jgi:hypothetical protein
MERVKGIASRNRIIISELALLIFNSILPLKNKIINR